MTWIQPVPGTFLVMEDGDDDGFLAELDAMVGTDNGGDETIAKSVEERLTASGQGLEEDSLASPSKGRVNPFLEESSTPPQLKTFSAQNDSSSRFTSPEPLVSSEEFERLQNELIALRNFKYESVERAKQLAAIEKEEKAKGEKKISTSKAFEKTMSLAGAFKKRLRDNTAKASTTNKQQMGHQDQVTQLQRRMAELESEILLHKETKDQLAEELQNTLGDFEDQRNSYQSTISDLTLRNNKIEAQLREIAAGDTSTKEGESLDGSLPQSSEDASRESELLGKVQLLQEEQHKVKILENKCNRLVEEAKRQTKDVEQLRGQLRRETDKAAQQCQILSRIEEDYCHVSVELNRERLRRAEQHAASLAHSEQLLALRKRLIECEEVMKSEYSRANASEAELQKANLLLQAASEERLTLTRKQSTETIETSAMLESLNVANKALTQELEEKKLKFEKNSTEITTVKEKLALATLDNNRLETENSEFKIKESQLLERVKELEKMTEGYSRLQLRLTAEEESTAALNQENSMLVTASEKLSATISAYEEALSVEREKVRKGEDATKEAEQKFSESEANAVVLNAKVKEYELRVDSAAEEQVRLTSTIESLTEDLTTLRSDQEAIIQSHSETVEELEATLSSVRQDLSAERKHVELLNQKLTDSEAQRKLDQKQNNKNIKNLTRQLQKHKGQESLRTSRESGSNIVDAGDSGEMVHSERRHKQAHTRSASETNLAKTVPSIPLEEKVPSTLTLTPRGTLDVRRSSGSICPHCSKKDQKILFYERHADDLTADVRNKQKIIQAFLLREQRGAIGPVAERATPPKTKSHNPLTRMASALGVNKEKGAMTLEIAMEVNSKLQQVVEDTLLQNMHLRESLDLMSKSPAANTANGNI